MQWKNGIIGGVGMALIGGIIDGPRYAVVMGIAGFIGGLFMFRNRPPAEPPRKDADK